MAHPEGGHPDAPVLDQLRALAGTISDERSELIVKSVIDAVALNPQPLPPQSHQILTAVINALNPQPLPPKPPPETGPPL